MTEHTPSQPRKWIVPMLPRSNDEAHRASTPLELFFDLVFVVAVAQAAVALHHGFAEGYIAESIISYLAVFFAIWWAWMGFTWFASSYDCDDVPYRLVTFIQLTGALIVAAGIKQAFEQTDYTVVVVGYVVMRLAIVSQYIRAGYTNPSKRKSLYSIAIGFIICQIGWVTLVFFQGQAWHPYAFFILGVIELFSPFWGGREIDTTWHIGHITERYGLFTIIVLGESILSASLGIQATLESGEFNISLVPIIIGGLLIIFCMWWAYFESSTSNLLTSMPTAFLWGYGHYFIFASIAAVGVGFTVQIDYALHHTEINSITAGMMLAIPCVLYLLMLWTLHTNLQTATRFQLFLIPSFALLILLTPFTSQPALLIGLLLVLLLVIKLVMKHRQDTK
jgi:low temperature requirement protein LtrA